MLRGALPGWPDPPEPEDRPWPGRPATGNADRLITDFRDHKLGVMGRGTPAVVVLGALAILVASCSPASSSSALTLSQACAGASPGCGSSVSSATDIAKDHWSSIADAPLAARTEQATVWTGKLMIVWGGLASVPPTPGASQYEPPVYGDGAALDPRTRIWRVLPPSPLAPRADATAVWDGQDMIIWGGQGGGSQTNTDFADGASYDPANHRWKMLPPGPLSARSGATAFWTGSQVLILGGYDDNTGLGLVNGATYDPKTGHWQLLPKLPSTSGLYTPPHGSTATVTPGGTNVTWTGSQVLAWPYYQVQSNAPNRSLTDVEQNLSWTPGSSHWVTHHTNPAGLAQVAITFWTGSQVLFFPPDGWWCPIGALCAAPLPNEPVPIQSYDPATGRWPTLAGSVVLEGAGPFIWTGRAVVAINNGAAVFDVARDRWLSLPSYPYGGVAAEEADSAVWTGSSLIVWGGGGEGRPNHGAILS